MTLKNSPAGITIHLSETNARKTERTSFNYDAEEEACAASPVRKQKKHRAEMRKYCTVSGHAHWCTSGQTMVNATAVGFKPA